MKNSLLLFALAFLLSHPVSAAQAPSHLRPRPGTPVKAPQTSALPVITPAQLTALAAEQAMLTQGVKTVPRLGVPGPVVAYGSTSFPILVAANSEAAGAAGSMGKGRAVIFGHTGYLGGESSEGNLDKLLLNAVRWCGRKDKPRVGVKGAKTASLLESNGLHAETLRALDKRSLSGFDVVIASAQGLTEESEEAALKEFIERGGGFIGAVTGWAFVQTSGGKEFASAHLGNRLLEGAGLAWTEATLADGPIQAPSEVSPLLNALSALSSLAPKPGKPSPATGELEQASTTLQLALSSIPPASRGSFQTALGNLLNREGKAPIPTPEKPLSSAEERAMVGLDARLLKFVAPADVKPHPAAASFPGRPGAQAKPVIRTITIDPNVPGWRSTGLYADAGTRVGVKCPPECAGKGYSIRIGCHTDSLFKLDQWKRMPEISTVTALSGTETITANPFGGLIYIVVPDKAKQSEPFQVMIAGGIESPLFILGQTTEAQWRQMIHLPSPWAELACKGVILSVPTAVAREIRDPKDLMEYWQRVIDAEDDLSNVADQRRRPERIVPDVQISAGYMHSGYPIMIHLPQAKEMTTYNSKQAPGWGFYHELGHNHQKSEWTFDGTGEVTCNLFSLYIFEAVLGKDKTTGHGAVAPEKQEEHWKKHQKAGVPFSTWKSDPFLALTSYAQLIDAFGFDTLKKVIRSYQGTDLGPLPRSDDEKRDQWMIRYSKISGKNLGPFFDAWGIPVSSEAKTEIESLPSWMPKIMR